MEKKAARVLTKTSVAMMMRQRATETNKADKSLGPLGPLACKECKSRFSSGFTLIEILIVLAIITAVIAVGMTRIQKKENNIKSVARQFTVLGKEIRNHARLTNSTLRLVVELNEKKSRYWVEKASGVSLRDTEEQKETSKKKDDEKPKSPFQIYKPLTKSEKSLPAGLFFSSLEIHDQNPVKEGQAYIHFSPEGFVDASALQISDGKKITWTLVFNPLTGQSDILTEAKSLKDITR